MKKIGRNDPCPCGSGLKYKKCCLKKQEDREFMIKKLDRLYASLKQCNNDLLDKANIPDYIGATFDDAINLSITSNALSLLKGFFQNNHYSITNALNIRNIIECYTLLQMNEKGDISDKQKQLFIEQYKLIEYQSYDKADGRYKDLLHLDELRASYNEARDIFLQEVGDEKKLKKIISSRVPFLCDEKMNFNALIARYCKQYADAYIYLSRMIHPSSYKSIRDEEYHNWLTGSILSIMIKMYDKYPVVDATTYTMEQNIVYAFGLRLPDNYGQRLYDIQKKEWEVLKKLSKDLLAILGGENYISDFIKELTLVMHDINTDSELGYTENVKLKFKVIVEMFACFDEVYFNSPQTSSPDYYYYMLILHDCIKDYEERGKELPEEIVDEVYNKFKKCYPTSVLNRETCLKNFLKALGYLMDEDGKSPGFTELVNNFLDKTTSNEIKMGEMKEDGTIKESNVTLRDYFKLLYKESNNMSHGSGYLFFANSGAWMDDVSIINFIDQSVIKLLMKVGIFFLVDNSEKNAKVAELCKDAMNKIIELSKEKIEILSIKRIKKQF